MNYIRVSVRKWQSRATRQKFYRAELHQPGGGNRILRKRCKTASAAKDYGLAIMARYHRLLDISPDRV